MTFNKGFNMGMFNFRRPGKALHSCQYFIALPECAAGELTNNKRMA